MIIGIFLLLACAFYCLSKCFFYNSLDLLFEGLTCVFALITSIMFVYWLCLPIIIEQTIADYTAIKITLTDARQHPNITSLERVAIMQDITKNNSIIQQHRAFHKHPLIGCFYSNRIADLDFLLVNELK